MNTLKAVSHNENWRMLFLKTLLPKRRKNKSGLRVRAFSIVEVMIACAVLAIGLTAVLQLLYSSLNNSFRDTEAIVATELAQEGLEYAYNIRDNNLVNGRPAFPTSGAFQFPGTSGRAFCSPRVGMGVFNLSAPGQTCFSNATNSRWRYPLGPTEFFNNGSSAGIFYSFANIDAHFARIVSINLDNGSAPKNAEVMSIVWWGQSSVLPTGVFTGANSDGVDISQCTRANHCVYVRALLTDWKPS